VEKGFLSFEFLAELATRVQKANGGLKLTFLNATVALIGNFDHSAGFLILRFKLHPRKKNRCEPE
jgi:hypothetical protein